MHKFILKSDIPFLQENKDLSFVSENEVKQHKIMDFFPGEGMFLDVLEILVYIRDDLHESITEEEINPFFEKMKHNLEYNQGFHLSLLIPRKCQDQYYLIDLKIEKFSSYFFWATYKSQATLHNLSLINDDLKLKLKSLF